VSACRCLLILGLCALSLAVRCAVRTPPAAPSAQSSFRVRSDFGAPLNADRGWAGALNEDVTIAADQPFRLRFEVERAPLSSGTEGFRLQYRRNAGEWTDVEAHDFPKPDSDNARAPRVSIVSCAAYKNGEATINLLEGSTIDFRSGAGVSLVERTASWTGAGSPGAGSHGEFEWAVVVRRFADEAVTNEPGDTFEFRMVEAGGALLGAYRSPLLRLVVPPGHVGGTFVETPGRIGPWKAANGDLYFIMEPAETSNLFMMVKSANSGRTWQEVDAMNRPSTRDLEAVDARLVGDTIHILHEVSRSARYHSFRTSDHPTRPDSWAARGELVANVSPVAQAAALEVRSDGSLVAFYVGPTRIHYRIRSPAGVWGVENVVDPNVGPNLAGPQAVRGANDTVHLAYYGTDGTIWYRRLLASGVFTDAQLLATGAGTSRAEYGAVLPLIYIPESNTVVIMYRLASGRLWERRVVNDAPPTPAVRVTDRDVITDAVDSQQPGADAMLDGRTVHVLFIEPSSRSIFSTRDSGSWEPSTLTVDKILGSWIRGNIYTRRDGARVYGYIYDAGSNGGAGMNRFGEIVLSGR